MRVAGRCGVRSFVHQAPAERIVFGVGTIATIGAELDRMKVARAVVLSTRGHADLAARVAGLLGHRAVGQFPGAVPHTPVEVTEQALEFVSGLRADAVVSVGGGSTTGLGKAVASRLGIQHLVVPTTYAGSELTPMLGETSGGEKTTRSGPEILPDTVIYDVQLTTTLPWSVTVTSAVNAMAHAVEALYSKDADDETDQWATQAIRSLVQGLHALRGDLDSLDARRSCSMAPVWPAVVSAPSAWGCTTSSATRSAAPSTCRMPRPTPWFSRTPWPTTSRPRPRR